MRSSFGTRFGNGGGEVQGEIVEFAASKLICKSKNIQTGLDDDQKLGMENHLTPFVLALTDILFSQLVWLSVLYWNSIPRR